MQPIYKNQELGKAVWLIIQVFWHGGLTAKSAKFNAKKGELFFYHLKKAFDLLFYLGIILSPSGGVGGGKWHSLTAKHAKFYAKKERLFFKHIGT